VIPDELADALIPAAGSLPSAAEVGANRALLERVLSARPGLAPELERIVGSVRGEDPAGTLERLERERPEDLETLLAAVAGAYYMSDVVRERLGYPGQRAIGLEAGEPPLSADSPLLGPVVQRGPIYRPAP
jgi:hypothetical protein